MCLSSGVYATNAKLIGSDLTLNAGESTTLTVHVKEPDNTPLKNKMIRLFVENDIECFDRQWEYTDSFGAVNFKITAPKSAGTYKLSYELGTLFETDGTNNYFGSQGSNKLTVIQTKTENTKKPEDTVLKVEPYVSDLIKKYHTYDLIDENTGTIKKVPETKNVRKPDVTVTLPNNEFSTSYGGNSNAPFYVSLTEGKANVITKNYKRIDTIKLTTRNGYSVTYKNGENFKDKRMNNGYGISLVMYQHDFYVKSNFNPFTQEYNKEKLKYGPLKKIEINFQKQPNLAITKVKKTKNSVQVTVKNKGVARSDKCLLGSKLSGTTKSSYYPKKVTIPSLNPGKSKVLKIHLSKSLAKKYKIMYIKADYYDKIFETTKSDDYKYISI